MINHEEFIKKIENVLQTRMGTIVGSSILKNQLAKLNKEPRALLHEDCDTLLHNIIKSASVFQTEIELARTKSDLGQVRKDCL